MVADFETTVFDNQTYTEVWASACVELFTEDVKLFHSIREQFEYLKSLQDNIICYFHNLKFDGSFWLSFFMVELGLKQAIVPLDSNGIYYEWKEEKDMVNGEFKYSISDMGQWYNIIIKVNNHYIELRDSLKLLPFSVKEIGNAFKTKHRKLDMEYKGFRYAGCEITLEEQEYIKNDVLVVKEALEVMYEQGHTKMTIGSCCLSEFKSMIGKEDWAIYFPDMTTIDLDPIYKYRNADAYIRKSYKGGWCYLVEEKAGTIKRKGLTADVNSLYPSMMSSESGNRYPVGKPYFWSGNFIDPEALKPDRYFFIRIKTRFYLKDGYLPFVQIKGNLLYDGTEMLRTSDVRDPETGEYSDVIEMGGKVVDTRVELTLTCVDYALLKEHYNLVDFEILDGCWFYTEIGIFDPYIEKYKKIKLESKGALRTLAKLFLNNLYGKLASSDDSSFKLAYIKEDGSISFKLVPEHKKQTGYIPIGSAITSYARNYTIRAAQKNYHGVDQRGFIYADTDSIHCDLEPEELVGVPVHDKNFCHWKLEAGWDEAIFTRQKTYVEHITHEDLQPIEKPYYNVKCAGMPEKCKRFFIESITGTHGNESEYTAEEYKFVTEKRTLLDFKEGLKIHGKLLPKRIRGGIVLCDTYYEMR